MVILTEAEIKRRANQQAKQDNQVPITVQKIQSIGGGRYRIKIAQTRANLIDMTIDGRKYKVTRDLGRGRYIALKGALANDTADNNSKIQG